MRPVPAVTLHHNRTLYPPPPLLTHACIPVPGKSFSLTTDPTLSASASSACGEAELRRRVASAGAPTWVALADLYCHLGEDDTLRVIRERHLTKNPGVEWREDEECEGTCSSVMTKSCKSSVSSRTTVWHVYCKPVLQSSHPQCRTIALTHFVL